MINMDKTLVIMAAGMGSRYGGNKQIDGMGPHNEVLMLYSIYDAVKAGFNKVVFIIKHDFEDRFRELVGDVVKGSVKVEYAFQELGNLPAGCSIPAERTKPLGTVQAILAAKDLIHEPFAVINADDYYGSNAFFDIANHLRGAKNGDYAMTAYALSNTLSPNGTVSRGVCTVENGYLAEIEEITKIAPTMECEKDGKMVKLAADTPVSMNLWGLTPDIFDELDAEYKEFLKKADLMKDEFFIPTVIKNASDKGIAKIKVFENKDKWYGITYREDLQELKNAIGGYIREGLYRGI